MSRMLSCHTHTHGPTDRVDRYAEAELKRTQDTLHPLTTTFLLTFTLGFATDKASSCADTEHWRQNYTL